MRTLVSVFILALSLLTVPAAQAQASQSGPVFDDYGATYPIENPDFATPTEQAYRVVFDVKDAPDETDALNPLVNTVARFMNMHARAGVPVDSMDVVLVLHGRAGKYTLDHDVYRERYGTANPNLELMEALHEQGVHIVLCGQTAGARDLPREHLSPIVDVALSAMTALITLQQQGYALIAF